MNLPQSRRADRRARARCIPLHNNIHAAPIPRMQCGHHQSFYSCPLVIALAVVFAMLPTLLLLRRAVKRRPESIRIVKTLTLRLETQPGQPIGLSLKRRTQTGLLGLAVSAVEPDSAAARVGVSAGGVLLQLDGAAATSTTQVAGLLLASGGLVELSVAQHSAATSPSQSAAAAPSVKGKLRAARKLAAGRRLRVSFVMAQAGWALLVLCVASILMFGKDVLDWWWLVPTPWCSCLVLLALFPTDRRAIRPACFIVFFMFFYLFFFSVQQFHGCQSEGFGLTGCSTGTIFFLLLAVLYFGAACAIAPTLRCALHAYHAMPRPALRRLWTVISPS